MKKVFSHIYSFLIILMIFMGALPLSADNDFPIVAYYGIPHAHASESRYKEFKDAGFNISIDYYSNADDALKCLNYADKHGIKLILAGNYVNSPNVNDFVNKVRNHNALYGYSLKDEPKYREYNNIVLAKNAIRTADKGKHPFYLNLFPNYGNWMLEHIGVKEYKDYVNRYAKLDIPQISFDFYPFLKKGERKEWYMTLMDVRNISAQVKKPFWGFILITPHSVYKQPKYEEIRIQAFVNLAFGAQGLQYFTYWTPSQYDDNDFHDAPIGSNGKRTKNYNLVKRLNSEIKLYTKYFQGAIFNNIGCLGDIPKGMNRYRNKDVNYGSIKLENGKSIIVSAFTKDKYDYLVIVNRDTNNSATVSLQNKPNNLVSVSKTGVIRRAKNSYTINKGDILLLRLS